jgi:hypothetical protein
MTYTSTGIIQASDYNEFVGGTAANVSGQLNTVLNIGRGNAGYGQSAVANVAAVTDIVTATQWTTLVNAVNTVRKHQSGAGFTNIGTYSAGQTVNAANDISGNLTTAYTNRLTYTAQGVTTTGATFSPVFSVAAQTAAVTFQLTRTATFASADQARYFFNAGGQLNFVFICGTNTGATTRGQDLIDLAVTYLGSKKVGAQDCVAKTGTGGTTNTDLTTGTGYYARTTANVTLTQITATAATYTGDNIILYGKTNGAQGTNADNGTVFSFGMDLTSAAKAATFNQSINITLNHRVDVIYPETTFLANTWGSVTIA